MIFVFELCLKLPYSEIIAASWTYSYKIVWPNLKSHFNDDSLVVSGTASWLCDFVTGGCILAARGWLLVNFNKFIFFVFQSQPAASAGRYPSLFIGGCLVVIGSCASQKQLTAVCDSQHSSASHRLFEHCSMYYYLPKVQFMDI